MVVHATKNNIPNKPLWLLVLILGGIIGGIVYYFAVYKDMSKNGKNISKRTALITTAIILLILAVPILLFTAASPPSNLKMVPLSEVMNDANNGQIERIDVRGDELKITKKGDIKPTEMSRKEKGSSLYEQGLTNKDVQLNIRN
jgi:heme/copper-type cytochrome/quinol oxidase subunit 2